MSETRRRGLVAAAVLVELRQKGLQLTDLSELTGLSVDSLRDRLDGRVAFDVDELETVGNALEVSIVTLLGSEK